MHSTKSSNSKTKYKTYNELIKEGGSVEDFKEMLKKKDPNKFYGGDNWSNVLIHCADENKVEFVELLLKDKRVDPSADDNFAIGWSADKGHEKVVQLLLNDKRVDPSADDNYAIGYSARYGHEKVVQLLLNDKRVDPSANDNGAIRWSAEEGHSKVVQLLLNDKRVDPSDRNNYAIRMAVENGHKNVVKLLLNDNRIKSINDKSVIKFVLSHFPDEIRKDSVFRKVLFSNQLDMVKWFMMKDEKLKSKYQKYVKGLFYEGDPNGFGSITKKSSILGMKKKNPIYVGYFLNGKKHGNGRVFFDNNQIQYYGEFENDKKHGIGIECDIKSKEVRRGEWRNDKFVKSMVIETSIKEIDPRLMENFQNVVLSADYKERKEKYFKGSGSYGSVYIFNKRFAFKHFDRIDFNNFSKKQKENIMREIGLAANVKHPNIIQIVGVSWKDPIGVVTELCDKSVFDLIKEHEKGKLPITYELKLKIVHETCLALEHLHMNHIMHRDLKWQNVLLTFPPFVNVKIIDFGFAKVNESFRESVQHSVRVGTPEYCAPEIHKGKYGYKADVFSFGIMLNQLVFEKIDPYRQITELMRKEPGNDKYWPKNRHLLIQNDEKVRPDIPDKYDDKLEWLVTLQKRCWLEKISARPSFTDIIQKVLSHTISSQNEEREKKRKEVKYDEKQMLKELDERVTSKCKNPECVRVTRVISKIKNDNKMLKNDVKILKELISKLEEENRILRKNQKKTEN